MPNYLKHIYPNKIQLIFAFFLEFINNMAVLGMGVLLFKILKTHNENSALWYLITRAIECIILIISGLSILMLLPISQEFMKTENSNVQILGKIAREWHFVTFEVALFFTGISGLILSFLLYAKKLVPTIISIVGIIGYTLIFSKSVADIFGYETGTILYMPGAIFELVFPIYLIIKGLKK